jgi:glycosyltransferase involved in cell wall biosynthesis
MDVQRKKIGILFNFRSVWMGGIIYIINIVKTLDFLDDEEKPEIFLFYKPDLKKFLDDFKYPYLHKIEWTFPQKDKGIIASFFRRRNVFIDSILKNYSLDAIYPIHDFPVRTKTNVKLISWWADLQEKHYPEFFTKKEFVGRDIRARLILKNCDDLVVSSQDVANDFNRFFKIRDGIKMHVFHFVSIIDYNEEAHIDEVRAKYQLPKDYFIVSNQFHKHKNHKVLLLALARLKALGIKKHMAFTGKFPAASDSPYLAELHKIIEDNDLHDQITMLGLISRSEQLQLMRHSQAVLQPSLFEGWSTVIEDAKSLQVPVVASNLSVNIEQLGEEHGYFDPHNADELVAILKDYPERNLNDQFYEDYKVRVKKAAKTLLRIFS